MLAAHRKWLSECTAAASVGSILSPLVELIHDPSSAEVALELPFAEAPLREALRRVASRHTGGKVVINMERE